MKKISIVDLHEQYKKIKKEIDNAIFSVLEDGSFIGSGNNQHVKKFEEGFANYLGIKNCIGCANGTDAIEIALKALGIGPNDEVIVPAISWISTSEAVGNVGATPIFIDVDKDYYTIDVAKIEEKITPKTKAIMVVHLYGLPAEMDSVIKIAKKYKLFIVEDCAQAHGAEYKNKKVGTLGDIATFSFFPSKNLGAYGDAGCVVTGNDILAETCRRIANHGQLKKNEHLMEGRNSRLDGIQAAVLSVKLKYLDEWNNSRIKIAKEYNSLLKNKKLITPKCPSYSKHVYHIYAIQLENRDAVQNQLSKSGIGTSVHYPTPLPLLKPYEKYKYTKNDFPNAYEVTNKILSLPMYPELKKDDITYIASLI